ncbi:unnamed protein product [Cyprideis torosa]|uniref:Uncharacterized protein n=1 Tax=Cyprideis torosa TaxID=163714 RepID=A0A7R8WQJ9_9CRUS|nr:unnamed protein product [Cyprideis torosa]CAG0902741.1 unnamed protein product [Cyprideis torosa]
MGLASDENRQSVLFTSLDMKAEFIDLSKRLRQERLYVASEKKQILQLNVRIVGAVEQLSHSAWKNQQQRETLEKLILARPDSLPHMSCQRAQGIDRAQFVDAHRILGHYVSCYGEFLQHLRENPSEVATCLDTCHVSSVGNEGLAPLIFIVLGSVYGNCILQQDEENVLLLLRHLIRLQKTETFSWKGPTGQVYSPPDVSQGPTALLTVAFQPNPAEWWVSGPGGFVDTPEDKSSLLATSENPRRLLVQGLGAFSRLYRSFSESHFPARVFLTAALHQPLLSVLMSDEVYLDGDSNKALMRLSPDERERLFGADESCCEYLERLKAYMQTIRQKVICLTSEFIAGITGHLFCFPPSIAWLIRQVHEILSQAGSYSPSEVRAVCVDLIFPLLICPAIVNPEPYGISSQAHVTPTARFNLIRIATVLQGLAHSVDGSEDLEGTLGNLYAELDRGAVTSFVDALVSLVSDDDLPPRTLMEVSSPLHGITRSAALITEDDLATLISFFRAASRTPECEDLKNLQTILSNLPHLSAANGHSGSRTSGENGSSQTQGTPPSASKRQGLLNKVSFPRRRPNEEDGLNGEVLSDGSSDSSPGAQQVLVVPLQSNGDGECPGMLSEMKFLSLEGRSVRYGEEEDALSLTTAHTTHRDLAQDPLRTGGGGTKRTRFSLSQDDGSIGNASDNLEGVSETASNPSPASSIGEEEEEVINDNLSDMVLANVSGRGTPNVSGKGTPSSSVII